MVWRTAWCLRPADVHNRHPLSQLFHEQERRVYDDSAYARQKVLIHSKAPTARDFTNKCTHRADGELDEVLRSKSRSKLEIRAWLERADE
jgi:IS5 family transposase